MKLSIFTTVTDPVVRGDNPFPSLDCYKELADELVIVDGGEQVWEGTKDYADTIVHSKWPSEFSWQLFGSQFQAGYEACTGDWVLRADLDYVFHQDDFKRIREAIEQYPDAPGLALYKYQFVLPDRYNLKSRLVVLVNKARFGNKIRFDGGGDMCQATLDGTWIDPGTVPEPGIAIYNYEKMLKAKENIKEDVGRMERAWERYYGSSQYGSDGTGEDAYKHWIKAQIGKFSKPQKKIPLSDHPKYIQQTIKELRPENWGYDGFGHLERNIYA